MLELWFNPEGFELGGQTFGPLVLLFRSLAFLFRSLALLLGLLAFLLSALAFSLYERGNPDTVCIIKA